jgi:hypothetical protein
VSNSDLREASAASWGSRDGGLVQLYTTVSEGIRATDDVSFKLLGFVPVVSGAGAAALTLLLTTPALGAWMVVVLAALGAMSTFGVYRWECRNVQTCNRMRDRAKLLETELGFGDLAGPGTAPLLFGRPFGKARSEHVIYAGALLVWLVPIIAALV